MQFLTQFAQVYGGGSYDSSAYGANGTTGTIGASSGSAAGGKTGTLTNTGFDVLLIATLACAIIFVSLVVRFWKRPTKQLDTPSAE